MNLKLVEYDNDAVVFITVPRELHVTLDLHHIEGRPGFIPLNEFDYDDYPEQLHETIRHAEWLGAELLYIKPVLTHRDVYEGIYRTKLEEHTTRGYTADRSSRMANIYAVKHTLGVYHKLQKEQK